MRVPHWQAKPADVELPTADHSTKGGAEALASVIRAAWAKVGVEAKVCVEKITLISERGRAHYSARLDMPGGLPARSV